MSKESKKIEKIEQEAKASELSEKDLEHVAGGGGSPAAGEALPMHKQNPVRAPMAPPDQGKAAAKPKH
jgi:hypothetical protein